MKNLRVTRTQRETSALKKSSGQALVETLITIPLLLGIGLGILQFALIWEAKLALNHATLMTARTGAVTAINIGRMQETLSKHLVSTRAPDLQAGPNTAEQIYKQTITELRDGMQNPDPADNNVALRIVNPTQEAFFDFGAIIPNDHLFARTNNAGLTSQLTIQEANVLRIQVAYGIPLIVPFVGNLIISTYSFYFCSMRDCELSGIGAANDNYRWWLMLEDGLFPVQAVATVRMHSPPSLTNANQGFFMSRAQVLACSYVDAGDCYSP